MHPMHWSVLEGASTPLGVTWIPDECAYNFALYSQTADRVVLKLFAPDELTTPCFQFEFDRFENKTGPVWHCRLPKSRIQEARYYGYSLDGPSNRGGRFQPFRPCKILLDPYARGVFFPPTYDRYEAVGHGSNAGRAPLGVLQEQNSFDWEGDEHPTHDSDLILYELHVRGFTRNPNSGVESSHQGTFLGLRDKVPYLESLGITAVELMPVFEFDETEPNYWGYMPINFFSPHHRYGCHGGTGEQVCEFKEMIKAFHRAGIEVILDVVYNHTGEGDERGPTFSFRGIDDSAYYIAANDDARIYADFSGTGNTLNCAHRAVRQLIVDSLRYWVREMHVDGFRFDLASVFSRNSDGSINVDDPPIFGDIASDPELSGVRMIAEPWEGNGLYPNYELGFQALSSVRRSCCEPQSSCMCPPTAVLLQRSFPGIGWRQWNDRFRTTVRHFVKSDPGYVADLMTRVYGSSDVFPDAPPQAYRPYQSVNYVTSHDGPTLYDLVSYNSDESWNCGGRDGEDGLTPDVIALRERQIKNFICLLMLSNGTPMFRSGDELLQTQMGNTNPYDLDLSLTWLDWSRLQAHSGVFRFFQKMIEFRKMHPTLGRSLFWRDDVNWHGIGRDVDCSYDSRSLAYLLRGCSQRDVDLYVMMNAYWSELKFVIQDGQAYQWRRVADTSLISPDDFVEDSHPLRSGVYELPPRSIAIFTRV